MEKREYTPKAIISGFRKASGYGNAEDIAKVLGVSKPTYLKYEKEPWRMSLGTYDELEKLFGEDFSEIFFKHKLYKKR